MRIQISLGIVLLCLSESYCHQSRSHEHHTNHYALKEQYYWGMPDFKFPNGSARSLALSTGSYIPENNEIWSIAAWKDKLFVSLFRITLGVASSLNYFSMNSTTKSPVLIPYPSFDANYINEDPLEKTLALTSTSSVICGAYIRIDKCDRLWVIDSGFIGFFGTIRVIAPPALVVFDLKTNTLLMRYVIPSEFVTSNSFFSNLAIDIKGTRCNDAYAYIVDMFRSIVVYSLKKNRSWRLEHNLFGSDPQSSIFHFEGRNIQWNFGAMGLAIGERHRDGSRRVYITPFSSTKSYYISNKILQDEAYIALNNYYYDVQFLGERGKHGQIYTLAFDKKTNAIFDTEFLNRHIGCWNTENCYRNSSFAIVYKSNRSFYPIDISVDRNRNLWMLSNNLSGFLFGSTWTTNHKNIQIFKGKVDDIISGTVCGSKLHATRPKPHH